VAYDIRGNSKRGRGPVVAEAINSTALRKVVLVCRRLPSNCQEDQEMNVQ
jgi:hypothetical protein